MDTLVIPHTHDAAGEVALLDEWPRQNGRCKDCGTGIDHVGIIFALDLGDGCPECGSSNIDGPF